MDVLKKIIYLFWVFVEAPSCRRTRSGSQRGHTHERSGISTAAPVRTGRHSAGSVKALLQPQFLGLYGMIKGTVTFLILLSAHILLDIYVLSDRTSLALECQAFIPLAALIGLGAAGSLWSGQQSRANVKDTIAGNMELAKYGYSKDLEMWNRQNEYNNPAAQMQRYTDAGLNPNLIYGQGNPGNATQLPKYNVPTVDYSGRKPSFDPTQVLQAMQMHQNFEVQNAQVDNLRAQQKNTEMKTITEATKNALNAVLVRLREFDIEKGRTMLPSQKAALDAGIARTQFETRKGETLLPYQTGIAKGQAGAAELAAKLAMQNLLNLGQQFKNMVASEEKTKADTGVAKARGQGIRTQTMLTGQATVRAAWENQIRRKYGITPNETLMGLISKALAEGVSKFSK